MPSPTQQDLNNAKIDLQKIAEVANSGPDDTIEMRLGEQVKSIAKAVQDLEDIGLEAIGDITNARDAIEEMEENAAASAASAALSADISSARQPYVSAAAALSNGVKALMALAGGSGGTNGQFALAFSGGGGSGAAGYFLVESGVVTSVVLTAGGINYTSAPTVSFAASSGLTGASVTALIGINQPPGTYFWIVSPASDGAVDLYHNNAGVAVADKTLPQLSSLIGVADRLTMLEGGDYIVEQLIGLETANSGGVSLGNQTYVISAASESDTHLLRVFGKAIAASTMKVKEVSISGGTITFHKEVTINLPLGDFNLVFPATLPLITAAEGRFLAVYSATAASRTAGLTNSPTPYYAIPGDFTTTAAQPALTTSVRLEMGFELAKRRVDLGTLYKIPERADLVDGIILAEQRIGTNAPASSANSASASTLVLDYQARGRGRVRKIKAYAQAAADIKVKVFHKPAADFVWKKDMVVRLAAGDNVLEWPQDFADMTVEDGDYLGFYAGANVLRVTTGTNNTLTTRNFNAAGDNTSSFTPASNPNTTNRYEIGFELDIEDPVDDRAADGAVHVTVTANASVKVRMYAGAGQWAEYEIEKRTSSGMGTGGSFNGWRTKAIWLAQKSRAGHFYRTTPVTARNTSGGETSEMDVAIQVDGAADFVGGIVHGFDQMLAGAFVLDGEVIDTTVTASYQGRRLEFRQAGTLYVQGSDVSNPANRLADYVKSFIYESQKQRLDFDIEWLRATLINKSYVGMMPMGTSADALYGQITDRTSRPNAWTSLDITSGGFSGDETTDARRTIWGSTSKIRADIQAVAGFTEAERLNRVEKNSGNYKSYFSFLGSAGSVAVTNGRTDSWSIEHRISVGV